VNRWVKRPHLLVHSIISSAGQKRSGFAARAAPRNDGPTIISHQRNGRDVRLERRTRRDRRVPALELLELRPLRHQLPESIGHDADRIMGQPYYVLFSGAQSMKSRSKSGTFEQIIDVGPMQHHRANWQRNGTKSTGMEPKSQENHRKVPLLFRSNKSRPSPLPNRPYSPPPPRPQKPIQAVIYTPGTAPPQQRTKRG
jgi:hypothetical protein